MDDPSTITEDAPMSPSQAEAETAALLQEAALNQLMLIIDKLALEPNNLPILREHLEIARRSGIEEQVGRGLEMLCEAGSVGEDLWLECLGNIESSLPQLTEERLPQVLSLLEKAATDYLSIPILQKTSTILTLSSGISPPTPAISPDDQQQDGMEVDTQGQGIEINIIPLEEARSSWRSVVRMAEHDLTQSATIWNQYKDWEERILLSLPEGSGEREGQLKRMHEVWIARLACVHMNSSETSQAYSTFNSTYSPESYESNMIHSTKVSSKPSQKALSREPWETGYSALTATPTTSPEEKESVIQQKLSYLYAYLQFEILGAGGTEKQDWRLVASIYEKLIGVVVEYEGLGVEKVGPGKEMEKGLWEKYGSFLAGTNGPSKAQVYKIWERSVRACPGSGDLWARLMRVQELAEKSPEEVGGIYALAISLGELTRKVVHTSVGKEKEKGSKKDQKGKGKAVEVEDTVSAAVTAGTGVPGVGELVKLELAWASFMRRQVEASGGEDEDDSVEATLREGIKRCRQVDSRGDPALKLEKYLISWLERKGDLEPAGELWEQASKLQGKTYTVWLSYTDFEIRRRNYTKARSLFKTVAGRANLDWPEAVWEAWISFEEYYGTAETLEAAKTRVAGLQEKVAEKRAQDAAKAQHDQAVAATMTQTQPSADTTTQAMDIDTSSSTKRKAEDDPSEIVAESSKKAKTGEVASGSSGKNRDREHSTVFVSGLNSGTTEASVRSRFADCGEIREITVTEQSDQVVATVEFTSRDSVPAALTKDKKIIDGAQITVYMAWKSTLFITNFPEGSDDASMRELFCPFGEIISTRWPSKKFKSSRRFLYLQYSNPSQAQEALSLHGTELVPGSGNTLSVFISEPERKKERSDAHVDEREIYVTGLSRFVEEKDLKRLFGQAGAVKRVNVAMDTDGHCKGYAFIEYEDESSIPAALAFDGNDLKKRKISVKMSDPKAKVAATFKPKPPAASGLGTIKDQLSRSIKLTGLPERTQEGLLHQELEKIVKGSGIKKVEVFEGLREASVELGSAADVGTLLLRAEPFIFQGHTLTISQETEIGRANVPVPSTSTKASTSTAPANDNTTSFKPRPPRAGAKKKLGLGASSTTSVGGGVKKLGSGITSESNGVAASTGAKGQDDFRKMLLSGKK